MWITSSQLSVWVSAVPLPAGMLAAQLKWTEKRRISSWSDFVHFVHSKDLVGWTTRSGTTQQQLKVSGHIFICSVGCQLLKKRYLKTFKHPPTSCYQKVPGLIPWSACWSVLGQDTEPQTAPHVLVGSFNVWMCVWITVSHFRQKSLLHVNVNININVNINKNEFSTLGGCGRKPVVVRQTQTLWAALKWNSRQKATKALFIIEYESNLRVKS